LNTQHRLSTASWNSDQITLRSLRNKINVLELRTPSQIEFDEKDHDAQHIIVLSNDQAIACGRLTRSGVISRICVLPAFRSLGVGANVLAGLVDLAKQAELTTVRISAKLDTLDFYTQYGFKPEGNVFMHAGLPRQHVSSTIEAIAF